MTRSSARLCTALACAGMMLTVAQSASAQLARTPRPYRALFDPGGSDSVQSLTASGGLTTGWDSNVLALGRTNALGFDRNAIWGGSGYFGAASGGLSYSRRTTPIGFSAGATSSALYFARRDSWITFQSVSAGADFSHALWSHATLRAAPTVAYTNVDRLDLFDQPDQGVDETFLDQLDYAVIDRRVLSYTFTTGVTQQLGARTTVAVSGSARYRDRVGGEGPNYRRLSGNAQWQYQFTRNAAVYVGYRYQQVDRGNADATGASRDGNSFDGGIRYGRVLSLSGRKTSLRFGTGTDFVGREPVGNENTRARLRGHVSGSAALIREISRSWYAQLNYTRGVRFYEDIGHPIMSDAVTAALSGYLGSRTDLSAVAAYVRGANAARRSGRELESYTGSVQLRYALLRNISVYTQYLYYQYHFGEGVILLRNLPSGLERHSARVGLSASLPLLR